MPSASVTASFTRSVKSLSQRSNLVMPTPITHTLRLAMRGSLAAALGRGKTSDHLPAGRLRPWPCPARPASLPPREESAAERDRLRGPPRGGPRGGGGPPAPPASPAPGVEDERGPV